MLYDDMRCHAIICYAIPWRYAMLCYEDMLCYAMKICYAMPWGVMLSHAMLSMLCHTRLSYDKLCHVYVTCAPWAIRLTLKILSLENGIRWYTTKTKPSQVRCRTNLPWSRRVHVKKTSYDIWPHKDACWSIPRTVRALQTLTLSGGCALSVRTLWAHMSR